MQAPFPPPCDHSKSIRVGLALLLTSVSVLLTGVMAAHLFIVIRSEQQQRLNQLHQAMVNRVDYLKATQSYSECVTEAAQIPAESLFHSSAMTLQDQCQTALDLATLNRAQTLAQKGQLKDAIVEVQALSGSNFAVQAESFTWTWSNQILDIAEGYYLDPSGNLVNAVQVANSISPDNPLHAKAQAKIQQWRLEWSANRGYWQAAQTALSQHQPEMALWEALQITHPHWEQQVQPIISAANMMITAQASNPIRFDKAAVHQPVNSQPVNSQHLNDKALPLHWLVPLGVGSLLMLRDLSE